MAAMRIVVFGCQKTAGPVIGDATARSEGDLPDLEYKELPCLGALDPLMMLRELDDGADKVLGVGCYVSRCEHVSGSQRAKAAIDRVSDVLEEAGVDRSRVGLVLGSPIDPGGLIDDIKDFFSGDGGEDE